MVRFVDGDLICIIFEGCGGELHLGFLFHDDLASLAAGAAVHLDVGAFESCTSGGVEVIFGLKVFEIQGEIQHCDVGGIRSIGGGCCGPCGGSEDGQSGSSGGGEADSTQEIPTTAGVGKGSLRKLFDDVWSFHNRVLNG